MRIKIKYFFCALFATVLTANASQVLMTGNRNSNASETDTISVSDNSSIQSSDNILNIAVVNKDSIISPNYIDEVVWIVGDEPILRSDIELMRLQGEQEGINFGGDPDCRIPEEIAVQKLFLHQAALDSIEVTEAEISSAIEQQINMWVQMIGSREKLEEYRKQSITQIRQELRDELRNRQLTQRMREKLVENVKVTPADVRKYFNNIPSDSVPFVPTEVEVQIITRSPKIPQADIDKVKDELHEYTNRVTSGQTTFATLARLYSEDPGSARLGGELDYTGRGMLDPAFAAVAFNLTDPKKISKIVESEFGYHIIQLIDKRGDKIKVRHILRKPRISQTAISDGIAMLDSVANEIRAEKFSFDDAATYISDDKDTRNNHGLMANTNEEGRTSKFKMKELPTEIARVVEGMKVGEISKAFSMINEKGKTVCAIVKLKSRTEGHRATITEDFQVLQKVVLAKEREAFLRDWIQKKIKDTYVKMDDRYRNCNFQYDGWVR